ncbi:restriction endonuclease [Halorubrum vacuolatum]|uniref:Restriction endonuclease n=1 Tax=Halorubrum vacuolatum TaxID=63740 RepID=A0A238WN99_HALVU|nr:restriction endonuclease [Halorubrum vacuolatum]SNR48026.1 Restriction endonuclease [Halorubrum vacuolatum]
MKRFLRYFLYRELYRFIRNAGKDDNSNSSRAGDSNEPSPQSTQHRLDELPLDDGPIENANELKTVLQQMDPYDFEHFIADLWDRMGWQTEVSSAAMDEGVDVTARKQHPYEQTTLIQAKRYGPNTTVGSPDIQQYASLGQQYSGVDKVVLVTTNEFTSQARDLADRLNVKLINGDNLVSLVIEYDALDLVDNYLEFVTTVESEHSNEHPQKQTDAVNDSQEETAEPTAQPESELGTETRSGPVPSTLWEKVIIVAIPGWIVAFFGVETLPETLWAITFLTVWFGLPVALFLDARHVRESYDWPQYWWAYVVTSLIWLLAIIPAGLYLWRRRSIDGSANNDPETDSSSAPDTATTAETYSDSETNSQSQTASATSSYASDTQTESVPDLGDASQHDDDAISTTDRGINRMEFEYGDNRYYARTTTAPNGEYIAAYQDGRSGTGDKNLESGRVFLFEDDELRFTTEIDRPNACAVANDGTVAVVDWTDWGDTLSGTFHIFNESGHQFVKHEFDSNIGPVAITPDGKYAATSTFNPDCSTYLFDVSAGEQLLRHENQHGNVQQLKFIDRNGTWMLQLGAPDDDSAYGIDLGGHVIWKSEGLQRQARLETLLEDSTETDIHEAVSLLEEAMELASKDYEERNVAGQLAETHWKLAKTTKQEVGVTDEWWEHLNQAAQYYRRTLPRYAGKQGLAKVKRQQGKQHLAEGDEAEAHDCFEEIARLEDEYDVQLLTDADQRRLSELR